MDEPATAVESRRGGTLRALADLYLAPREAFAALLAPPRFWAAFAVLMALQIGTAAVWLQKLDREEFIKAQWEEWGVTEKIPAEKRAEVLESAVATFDRSAWLGVAVIAPVGFVAIAGLYLFLFRFFLASEVTFAQSLAIVAHCFLATGLVVAPLSLLTLALKGDWNIAPELALQANLAVLLDKQSVARPLWALADSLDLFSFWRIFLLASGYRAAGRHGFTTALVAVAVPWVLYVLGKVGLAALF